MKTLFAVVSLALASAASSLALAQNAPATAAETSASAVVTSANLGAVESIDILKQNQAERSRDQPGNAAPTFRLVNDGTKHYSSLPGLETGVLIQGKTQFPGQARATTAGEAWRQYRNGPLTMLGGWLLLIVAGMIAGFYFWRGEIKLQTTLTGRLIERFTPGERTLHWSMALSFVALAVSGMIILFGKHVLLPVFGLTLFGWLAFLCKNIHNFIGPVFTISIILFFIKFVKDNLPNATDLPWLAKFGGLVSGEHVSSGRFNAGEKILFWGAVVGLGLVVSASGLVLDMLVPALEYSRANMQIANIVHVIAAIFAATMVMGHIYLGTLGMEGAYASMRTGYVDDAWAKEHHEAWYADIENGKVPRLRSEPAGNGSHAQPAHTANVSSSNA
ncbi:formate dehydrogenase subunit gamma [Undibacterium sp.]|uniref:formate dehydrogenase subunit gamma n=1 Tax=Undibacterium sp. TaxID=1914977 RepID=UPI0025E5A0FE|nr:formate dehydrogenase subunit gamma [Undibacterium sp.]